jgi:hypothetical protein
MVEISIRNRLFKRGEKVYTVRYSPKDVFNCNNEDSEDEICEKVRSTVRLIQMTGVPSVDFSIGNI